MTEKDMNELQQLADGMRAAERCSEVMETTATRTVAEFTQATLQVMRDQQSIDQVRQLAAIARFLQDRDEALGPDEATNEERQKSAAEIYRMVVGGRDWLRPTSRREAAVKYLLERGYYFDGGAWQSGKGYPYSEWQDSLSRIQDLEAQVRGLVADKAVMRERIAVLKQAMVPMARLLSSPVAATAVDGMGQAFADALVAAVMPMLEALNQEEIPL